MELMFAYFWVVKLLLTTITLFFGWKFYKSFLVCFNDETHSTFGRNVWGFLFGAMLLFGFINPIKMDTGTYQKQQQDNRVIQQSKKLEPMVKDDSFNKSVNKEFGISNEDLK